MRVVLCVLALAIGLLSGPAFAGSKTFTGVASADITRVPTIPSPAGAQQTSFSAYDGGSYRYNLYVFTVDQTGTYTATSATSDVVNTTWVLNGLFSPHVSTPAAPLSAFIVGVFTDGSKLGRFSALNLTAGQTYTALVAYNVSATAGVSSSTFTITGPGEIIDCSGATCATGVPTLSEWALILLGLTLAGGAAVILHRRRLRPA